MEILRLAPSASGPGLVQLKLRVSGGVGGSGIFVLEKKGVGFMGLGFRGLGPFRRLGRFPTWCFFACFRFMHGVGPKIASLRCG